jgi:putative MATE family efflux protein
MHCPFFLRLRQQRPPKERSYVLRLSFPAIFENLTATMMQITNMIMVGGLGASATATVAVNSAPTWVINSLVMAVGVGSTALVARSTGAKQQPEAEAACGQTFLLGLFTGAVLSVLTYCLAPLIPVWMHADPSLYSEAAVYMRILSFGFLPYYTGVVLASALRGAGDMATPMKVSTTVSILNIVAGFFLIYPARQISFLSLSFPVWGAGLGVRGAAISTSLTTGLSGIWLIFAVIRNKSNLRLRRTKLRPDFSLVRQLLTIGTPAALERLSISLGQVIFIGMVAALGTAQLASHHLVVTIESLSYMPGYGFAAAASTLVGQSLGAGDGPNARLRGALSIRLCVITMSLIGVLLFLLAPWWMTIFTPDMEVQKLGASLLRICSLEQPATALYLVSSGALRGAGETRAPFLIAFVSMGLRLVLAYIFIMHLNMGTQGAWWAMVIDLWVRGLLTYTYFRKGRWSETVL